MRRHPAPRPPAAARRLLQWFCAGRWLEEIEGDLAEQFRMHARVHGLHRARLYYWKEVVLFARPYVVRRHHHPHRSRWIIMLRNYLKIALRTIRRHPGYALINVTGLAVGMACCLLIALFVRYETSFDQYAERADRTYRLALTFPPGPIPVTPNIAAPLFKRTFPEVVEATRLYDVSTFQPPVIRYQNRAFTETGFMYADSTVFEVFTRPFLRGDPETALTRKNTLVMSASTARKYFGDDDPIGKIVDVGTSPYEVTGVFEDLPATSHLHFDLLASFVTTRWADSEVWVPANFITYVVLREGANPALVQQKMAAALDDAREQGANPLSKDVHLLMQALPDIHLRVEGHITYVYLFSAIALLILLIACINYMNLATARSARRSKEVGLRKVLGAYRSQLTGQFFGESLLMVVTALLLSVALACLALPLFNGVTGLALPRAALWDRATLLLLLGAGLAVTIVAGSYPAIVLSGFKPVRVLKGEATARRAGRVFRQGLVVFQFAISVFLIASTLVVFRQLRYIQQRNLGFDDEQVVVLSLGDQRLRNDYTALKERLLDDPGVLHASAVNSIPGTGSMGGYSLQAEGLVLEPGESFSIGGIPSDADVVETLGLHLVAGRGFPQSEGYQPADERYAYILNEEAVRRLGWTPADAIGRRVAVTPSRHGHVVGVVKDFHYGSLHDPILPVTYFLEPSNVNYLLVKIAPANVPRTLDAIEATWDAVAPFRPFEVRFLDDQIDAQYRTDRQVGDLFTAFAVLAIVIACLGLFGLAAFAAEQRTKEIGVRKVMGASAGRIVVLLSRDFTRLVLLAFVIAVPVAYLVMARWLDGFAYRTSIAWWIFAATGAAALAIAWLTVGYQSIRAAVADPVVALRHE